MCAQTGRARKSPYGSTGDSAPILRRRDANAAGNADALSVRSVATATKELTAVLHWKIKPTLFVALLSLAALVAGYAGGNAGTAGFYW